MEHYFGWVQAIGTGIVLVMAWLFGTWDGLLATFTTFVVIDYATGFLGAWAEKKVSSDIGRKGIAKKIFLFATIAVAVLLDRQLNMSGALRMLVISFYIANEGISIIENISKFVPVPQQVKDALMQLRDKNTKEADNNE